MSRTLSRLKREDGISLETPQQKGASSCVEWRISWSGDPYLIPGLESTREGIGYPLQYSWASLVVQLVKNPPAMQETPVQLLGSLTIPGEGIGYPLQHSWASLVVQLVKNPPAMWETWV